MTNPPAAQKPVSKTMSIEEEIAKATEKLKMLQKKQKELQRKEREKSQKAVYDLIKAEKLDSVGIDHWTKAMPEVKKLLGLVAA